MDSNIRVDTNVEDDGQIKNQTPISRPLTGATKNTHIYI